MLKKTFLYAIEGRVQLCILQAGETRSRHTILLEHDIPLSTQICPQCENCEGRRDPHSKQPEVTGLSN